ncbi:hypothetical protein KIN20_005637 [Parelaphostrongylus tenuis]|uniref:CBS domain-containing protein n=1 Tax=Parelaphostrongylus tenuis TaxID=148309 RepID=A0AAD5M0F9_PARTN|nr:hypothetical protein KIN20_005637 [Parelaphostrongylus tenuis]
MSSILYQYFKITYSFSTSSVSSGRPSQVYITEGMSNSESVSSRSLLTMRSVETQAVRSTPPHSFCGLRHTCSVIEKSAVSEVPYHEPDSYARLLQMNQCYEAMPTSSKMVIFDTELILWKAFNGLIYQNTRHVLLSNGEKVMLMLHRERKQGDSADQPEDIGKLTIRKYRELVQKEGKFKELVHISADKSLLEAARLLAQHRIHRLPVFDPDTGSPLFILTHKRLLKFLWCFGQQFSHPELHIRTAKDLNVGSWVGIRVVFPDTPLTDCLDILLNKGVSGVPVVERETFKVLDMYSRFDAVGIVLEENACLGVTVEQALKFKNLDVSNKDRVVSVRDTDTLWKAITVLVERNVHRLCAVNEKGAIEGIISLSDVINYMVVKPGANLKPFRPTRRRYAYHTSESSDKELRSRLHVSATLLEDTATGKLEKDIGSMTIH